MSVLACVMHPSCPAGGYVVGWDDVGAAGGWAGPGPDAGCDLAVSPVGLVFEPVVVAAQTAEVVLCGLAAVLPVLVVVDVAADGGHPAAWCAVGLVTCSDLTGTLVGYTAGCGACCG